MPELSATEIADRPIFAFVAFVVVGLAVSIGLQFVFDGSVNSAEAVGFAVAFAAVLVGFSYVRQRSLR